ncbi:MAG: hypothetical protein ABIG32_00570 [Candidatus Uhrbacteria bacterium]|nr:hypothetical protein [Patescibacteria group bacterium]MBU1907309.1 hypothetical protein [Patescibacteria group bacterium]
MRREIKEVMIVARSHLELDDYEDAEQALWAALKQFPLDPDLEDMLVRLRLERALPERDGVYARVVLRRAQRLYQEGLYEDVIRILHQVIALGAEDSRLYDLLAYSLRTQGDLDQAIATWLQHLKVIIKMCLDRGDLAGAEWRLAFLYHQAAKSADVVRLLYQVYLKQEAPDKAGVLFNLHQDILAEDAATLSQDDEESTTSDELDELMRRYLKD